MKTLFAEVKTKEYFVTWAKEKKVVLFVCASRCHKKAIRKVNETGKSFAFYKLVKNGNERHFNLLTGFDFNFSLAFNCLYCARMFVCIDSVLECVCVCDSVIILFKKEKSYRFVCKLLSKPESIRF